MTLDYDQMLELWLLTRYHLPYNGQSTVSVDPTIGADTRRIEAIAMRAWYLNLLDTAPAHLLPTADLSATLLLSHLPDGSAELTLPDRCRRVLSVRLGSWSVAVQPTDPATPLAARQNSPFSRGGVDSPVAILDGRRLRLYTPRDADDALTLLECVVDPGENTYTLDDSLLSTIPPIPLNDFE